MPEGYKNPTSDPRGLFVRFLPTPYRTQDTENNVHAGVIGAISSIFNKAERDIKDSKKELFLETADGDFLDVWGNFIGRSRWKSETDKHYRKRLKKWITAKKGTIEGIIDGVKTELDDEDVEISIYEPWRNIFYLNRSLLDGVDHLQGDYYQHAVIDVIISSKEAADKIAKIVDRYKDAGVIVYVTYSPGSGKSGNVYDLTFRPDMFKVDEKEKYTPDLKKIVFPIGAPASEEARGHLFTTDKSDISGEDVLAGDPNFDRFSYNFAGLFDSTFVPNPEDTFGKIVTKGAEFSQDIYPALNVIDNNKFVVSSGSKTMNRFTLATMIAKENKITNGQSMFQEVINSDSEYRPLLDVIGPNIIINGTDVILSDDAYEQLGSFSDFVKSSMLTLVAQEYSPDMLVNTRSFEEGEYTIVNSNDLREGVMDASEPYSVTELATKMVKSMKFTALESGDIEYSYELDGDDADKYSPILRIAMPAVGFSISENSGIMLYLKGEVGGFGETTRLIEEAIKAIKFTISEEGIVNGRVKTPVEDVIRISMDTIFVFNWDEYFTRNPNVGSQESEVSHIMIETIGSPYGFHSKGISVFDRAGNKVSTSGRWVEANGDVVDVVGEYSEPRISSGSYIYKLDEPTAVGYILSDEAYRSDVYRRVSVSKDGETFSVVGYMNSNSPGKVQVSPYNQSDDKGAWITSRLSDNHINLVADNKGDKDTEFLVFNYRTQTWDLVADLQINNPTAVSSKLNMMNYVAPNGYSLFKMKATHGDIEYDYLALTFNQSE